MKKTFAAQTFAARTFASGTWRAAAVLKLLRVAQAQTFCSGRAAGETFSTGSVIGECDGRSG
jgi:hypothetical protein